MLNFKGQSGFNGSQGLVHHPSTEEQINQKQD